MPNLAVAISALDRSTDGRRARHVPNRGYPLRPSRSVRFGTNHPLSTAVGSYTRDCWSVLARDRSAAHECLFGLSQLLPEVEELVLFHELLGSREHLLLFLLGMVFHQVFQDL